MSTFGNYFNEACGGCRVESMLPDVNTDTLLSNSDIEAAFEESSVEAAQRAMAENTINMNNILRACTIEEFACLEESGIEMVYEGAKLDSFIEKAKSFFKAVWEKIQSIYKKAVMQFNGWFQSDKDFLKKYEKDLTKAVNKGLADKEMDVYAFAFLGAGADEFSKVSKAEEEATDTDGSLAGACKMVGKSDVVSVEDWKEVAKAFTEDKMKEIEEVVLQEIMGNIDSSLAKVDKSDYAKLLKEYLRGDKDKKKLSELVDNAKKFLGESAKIKKALNDGLKASKKSIDKEISALEKYKKQLGKDLTTDTEAGKTAGSKHTVVTAMIRISKFSKNVLVQITGISLNELKACSRQCKSVCVKCVTAKNKKSVEEGGLLEQVQFV